jgi:hypothetical protein
VIKRSRVLATGPPVPPAIAGEGYELVWEQNFSGAARHEQYLEAGALLRVPHADIRGSVCIGWDAEAGVQGTQGHRSATISTEIPEPPPSHGNEGISRTGTRISRGPDSDELDTTACITPVRFCGRPTG